MLVHRTMQQSLRRFAVQQPSILSRSALSNFASPAAIAISNNRIQTRHAATRSVNQDEGYQILVKQRLNRPNSPHLQIYKPQITSTLSILNRITGGMVSVGFYGFALSYLAAPMFGWHLESSTLAAAFGDLPLAAKAAIKFTVALPFTFHSINGIRHLVWDTGRELKNKQVVNTGWFVVGATVVSSGVLAYI